MIFNRLVKEKRMVFIYSVAGQCAPVAVNGAFEKRTRTYSHADTNTAAIRQNTAKHTYTNEQ